MRICNILKTRTQTFLVPGLLSRTPKRPEMWKFQQGFVSLDPLTPEPMFANGFFCRPDPPTANSTLRSERSYGNILWFILPFLIPPANLQLGTRNFSKFGGICLCYPLSNEISPVPLYVPKYCHTRPDLAQLCIAMSLDSEGWWHSRCHWSLSWLCAVSAHFALFMTSWIDYFNEHSERTDVPENPVLVRSPPPMTSNPNSAAHRPPTQLANHPISAYHGFKS